MHQDTTATDTIGTVRPFAPGQRFAPGDHGPDRFRPRRGRHGPRGFAAPLLLPGALASSICT